MEKLILPQDDATSKELNLALRRLIGGTGSHHVNARKSFYGTLTAYLKTKPETPAEKILEIMEKKLEPLSKNHKGVRIYTLNSIHNSFLNFLLDSIKSVI